VRSGRQVIGQEREEWAKAARRDRQTAILDARRAFSDGMLQAQTNLFPCSSDAAPAREAVDFDAEEQPLKGVERGHLQSRGGPGHGRC
jgi:hypothetical protein